MNITFTRTQLESRGLSLRTPPGLRILDIPAEFGWDEQEVATRVDVLLAFGFDHTEKILTRSDRTCVGQSWQLSQYVKTIMEPEFNLEAVAASLGITTDMGKLALEEALKNCQMLDKKQQDYGPNNIAKFGLQGCVVRASDKIERLIHLGKTGGTPKFESVEDSLRDMSNYGVIGLLCARGVWK